MANAAPLSAQDQLDVMALIARYAVVLDAGDVEGYVSNFAPSGVVEYSGGRCVGRDEIRAWVGRLVSINQVGPESRLRHVLGIPYIEGDGERCSARTYVMIPRQGEAGEIAIPLVLTYVDSCVKRGGRWLFEKRVIQTDLAAPSRRTD